MSSFSARTAGAVRNDRTASFWLRWIFVGMGVASLGYVTYSLADAKLHQAYENWQFDRAASNRAATSHLNQPSTSSSDSTASPQILDAMPLPESPEVVLGSTLGRIEISRIGVAVIIAEGTDDKTLRRGVGHITGTAFPGEPGNVGIAGHRDTFFRALRNIRQNDDVTLTTLTGSYRYRVDSIKVVLPEQTDVLNDSGESILTLVTCYPFYYVGPAPKRLIVRARRI